MKKINFILLLLIFTKISFAQTVIVSEWQSGKKLLEVTNKEARNYITNELVLTYNEGVFSNPKTGEKIYELNNDNGILSDTKTGAKLYEYKDKKVSDVKTGKALYVFNKSDKAIAEGESGKNVLGLSKGDLFSYRIFFILIATGMIK